MQLLMALGLIVTASLLIRVNRCRPRNESLAYAEKLAVNINDEAEKFNLDKCRGLIKEYVENMNDRSVTIVLDKVTKRVYDSGTLYYCDYTVSDAASNASNLKCAAYVNFENDNAKPTLTKTPCFF